MISNLFPSGVVTFPSSLTSLGIEPRSSCMLSKCSTTEHNPAPSSLNGTIPFEPTYLPCNPPHLILFCFSLMVFTTHCTAGWLYLLGLGIMLYCSYSFLSMETVQGTILFPSYSPCSYSKCGECTVSTW